MDHMKIPSLSLTQLNLYRKFVMIFFVVYLEEHTTV